jgi:hypothetical protein
MSGTPGISDRGSVEMIAGYGNPCVSIVRSSRSSAVAGRRDSVVRYRPQSSHSGPWRYACYALRFRLKQSEKVWFSQVRTLRQSEVVALGRMETGVVVTRQVTSFRATKV